jgi:ditrans,polycis-polyprenyl diphosphate synthase
MGGTPLTDLRVWAERKVRQSVAWALAARPVPAHVAFIMDGNRRYAEHRGERSAEGHAAGYRRLIAALEWCLDLGVRAVSVYAFSIDNYQRSAEEVATLMRLAEEKLGLMLQARRSRRRSRRRGVGAPAAARALTRSPPPLASQELDALRRHGVRVRVVGDLSLAPPAVRAAAARVEAATAAHAAATLNLCFSYTASHEALRALDAQRLCGAGGSGSCGFGLPSSSFVSDSFELAGCGPVDLLVRTSGESRLSDFLLWQSRGALLTFTPALWPDFTLLDLAAAVARWQRAMPALAAAAAAAAAARAADGAVDGCAAGDASPRGVATPGSPSSESAASDAAADDEPAPAPAPAAALRRRERPAALVAAIG